MNLFFYKSIQRLKHSGKIKESKNLIIDSTTVANKCGSEEVSISPGSRKHKGTKIHTITTEKGFPVAICFSSAKIHDIKKVEDTIKMIPISTRDATIVADKGYVSKDVQSSLKKQRIAFVAIPKKDMKKKLSKKQKLKLQKRYKIENFFARLKRFQRINNRMDRTIRNFSSFCYIVLLTLINFD